MKKIAYMAVMMVIFSSVGFAQFKSQLSDKPSIDNSLFKSDDSDGLLFGFFNPANFSMHQSVSMSFTTMAGQSMALGMYTNSMSYRISNPLTLSADVSLLNSPYSSLGSKFAQSINGIYLTRADLNYKPSDNFMLDVQFNQNPLYKYYSPYYYYNPWGWYGLPR